MKIWKSGGTKLSRDTGLGDFSSYQVNPKLKLFYNDFRKLNEYGIPFKSGEINSFGALYSTLISFENGKYIIMSESRMMPHNRGSAPDEVSSTYFSERVD